MAPTASKHHRGGLLPARAGTLKDENVVGLWVQPTVQRMIEALLTSAEYGGAMLLRARERLDRGLRFSAAVVEACCSCLNVKRFLRARGTRNLAAGLPIAFVVHIVTMLYNAFVFGYMPAVGLALNSPTSLIFHALIFLIMASFVQAARTDPGGVPDTAEWRCYGRPPAGLIERKASTGEARWCDKGGTYKPDRAHNCQSLGKCILRMDHYCPWLGNTIGFFNHKFFFLFLFYANAACGMLGISILQLLAGLAMPSVTAFLLMGAEGLIVILLSVLLPFFLFHCHLLATNSTTIEWYARMCSPGRDLESNTGDVSSENVYDVGLFRNICSVMGDNPLLWLIPLGGPSGDGLSFPTTAQPIVDRLPVRVHVKKYLSTTPVAKVSRGGSCTSQVASDSTFAEFSETLESATSGAGEEDEEDETGLDMPKVYWGRHKTAWRALVGEVDEEEEEEEDVEASECSSSASADEEDIDSDEAICSEDGLWCRDLDGHADDSAAAREARPMEAPRSESAWAWVSGDLRTSFTFGCQLLGESLHGSAKHVRSILKCNGKTKRMSVRRSSGFEPAMDVDVESLDAFNWSDSAGRPGSVSAWSVEDNEAGGRPIPTTRYSGKRCSDASASTWSGASSEFSAL